MLEVRNLFKRQFGYTPPHITQAPGRLELLGNHTDYNQGLVLSVAVGKFLFMASSPRTDGKIELTSSAFPTKEKLSTSELSYCYRLRTAHGPSASPDALPDRGRRKIELLFSPCHNDRQIVPSPRESCAQVCGRFSHRARSEDSAGAGPGGSACPAGGLRQSGPANRIALLVEIQNGNEQ